MGRFRASHLLVAESFEFLRKDKEVMLFPVLSLLACTALMAVLFAIELFGFYDGNMGALLQAIEEEGVGRGEQIFSYASYVLLFAYYILSVCIVVFFEVGVVAIVNARIHGGNMSFSDGVSAAWRKVGKIFVWACLTATVGVVLRLLSDRMKIVGKIIIGLLGATWDVLTFFVVPVLALEDVGIKDSIARSAQTFKKTWGETFIINISAGLFFGALMFASVTFFVGVAVLLIYLFEAAAMAILVVAAILTVLSILVFAILSATLSIIFRVALYEYAKTGRVPPGFSPELILTAIAKAKPPTTISKG